MSDGQLRIGGTATRRTVGPVENAATKTLTSWRADGHHVDRLASAQLRGAAADVDAALSDYRHRDGSLFTVTRARALLHELYLAYRPPAAAGHDADPFAALVEQLAHEAPAP